MTTLVVISMMFFLLAVIAGITPKVSETKAVLAVWSFLTIGGTIFGIALTH